LIYVDANFWIYWFDERLPEHIYVTKPMRKAVSEGIVLNISTLMEIAHYFRHLPPKEFQVKMDMLQALSTVTLVDLNMNLAKLAFEHLKRYAQIGVGARDSVILATMDIMGIKRIATHDEVFKRIKALEVIDSIPKKL